MNREPESHSEKQLNEMLERQITRQEQGEQHG